MLSTKLVRLIESNWEEIATRLTAAVRKHPDLAHLAGLSDLELRGWCQEILEHLNYLLSVRREEEVWEHFEEAGMLRYEQNKLIGFIHEQGFSMNAAQLYAEEELEHRINVFLDACVYHIVRGYEAAIRLERRLHA